MRVSHLCLVPLLFLAACGFQPMYGHSISGNSAATADGKDASSTVVGKLGMVDIAIIPDRSGQILRNDLIDRFYAQGTPSAAQYHLTVAPLKEARADLDITKSSESTRSQLRLTSSMTLTDTEGKILATRTLFAIASFNVLQSEFATRVTENNARENAIHDLARQIELNVGLALQDK